jgi:hypothetical protein
MSKHVIYEIIEDLGIYNDDTIRAKISKLDRNDAEFLLDKMELWYSKQQLKEPQKSTVLDFWVPTSTENSLYAISSNLLFSNSIVLVDPLFDHLALFSSDVATRSIMEQSHEQDKYVCPHCFDTLSGLEEDVLKAKISEIIKFYLRSKPLIEEGKLTPHIDLSTGVGAFLDDVDTVLSVYEKYDKDVKKYNENINRNLEFINDANDRDGHIITNESIPFLIEYMELNHQKIPMLLSIEQIVKNQSIPALSIDFLGHISDGLFRALIKYFRKLVKDKLSPSFIAPSISHYATIPTLAGIPIQIIPEILVQEKDALDQFRASMISSIASISAPQGTQDWYNEIHKLRANLQRELIELERVMIHIKKDHIKRQAENIFLLGFSITLASLALAHQTLDPISAIQTMASGASLSAGIKNVIDSWLDYQKQVNEQRRRDEYFLWRLQKSMEKID